MIRILISLLIIISTAATATEYDRKEWRYWVDADKDCEDTREEAIVRDAYLVLYTNSRCTPVFGIWLDPYTDTYFANPKGMDADHIVPLKHAHNHGASSWSKEQKKAFANDLENIIMVDAGANRSKGARAPHEWMPEDTDYGCKYLEDWNYVKQKYNLLYSAEEKAFITKYQSNNCK